MISLPSLRRLDVDGYDLYPGRIDRPGLHIEFQPGLTLALGANGLGKTTLVTILYRMLTGPSELSKLPDEGSLGGSRLAVRPFNPAERGAFAARVVDGARSATATLAFELGGADVAVTRRLDTLTLTEWSIDGVPREAAEAGFTDVVAGLASVASWADWILALRHLVFYFEDRRALVWDPSAQRQLLRFLFLPPEQAHAWRELEGQVLSLDSDVRNVRWQYNREQAAMRKVVAARAAGSAEQLRERIGVMTTEQAAEQQTLEDLRDALVDVSAERQEARLAALTADVERESAILGVERLQLDVIAAAFPAAATTAQYMLGQILSTTSCLVCLSDVPDYRAEVEERIRRSRCPVCSSAVDAARPDGAAATEALGVAEWQVATTDVQLAAAAHRRATAEAAYQELLDRVSELEARTTARAAEIADTVHRLPAAEQDLHEHQSTLAALGARLEISQRELDQRRGEFDAFVRKVNVVIAERKDAVKEAFDGFAQAFLVESAALIWEPRRAKVGQLGGSVEFPAFSLDLSTTGFGSPVRRSGPDNVSESQREFIDLSFRMALMEVATEGGATLIVDAPESSIDAVFAGRAASVLMRFAGRDANRVMVTSNLVEGDLVPRLLGLANVTRPDDARVVDLLDLAAPTAATRQYGSEYQQAKERMFVRAAST
ncbi:MAG: hypothetical protein WD794_15885 [Mycobacteriales bacterium]